MNVRPLQAPRFVRRTRLGPDEYRKNFRQIDGDIISTVTSPEADRVTPLMSKIYLRLVHAPVQYWEREGVLCFESELRGETHVKAWNALCEALGVASATANKALRWMHEQGIVGYFAGKNGVGIRIFLNRAASSIGSRVAGKKILAFPPASSAKARASRDEAAFSDSYAVSEVLEKDLNPRAPKNGAEQTKVVYTAPAPHPTRSGYSPQGVGSDNVPPPQTALRVEVPIEEIVSRLRHELEPSLQSAARRAAAQEHERTREWLESRGLPKAARVAQREAYNVLRKYGVIRDGALSTHADVGRSHPAQEQHQPLSDGDVEGLAQACLAMLEVKGQSVELTLSEISVKAGGFLLPSDASRVHAMAQALLDSP
ncbi:MAG: hypothetical protein QOH49_4262 [Acidobacteriota bacterium]|jgi:hypothetical protein|nr:hypothetical protein [Acidobacteriota bacterium]